MSDVSHSENRDLFFFEHLGYLLSYRSLDELLAEALSFLIRVFRAAGGSIIYISTLSGHVRQGDLEGAALEQISRWERTLRERLRSRKWQIQLPSVAPVTRQALPDEQGVLLNIPLIGHERVRGAISLYFPPDREPSVVQEQMLGRVASGMCAAAACIEQLAVTRQRLGQLGLFYQMGQAMTSTFDINRLFQDTIELAVAVIDAQAAKLLLFDEEQGVLVHELSLGGSVFPQARKVELGQGVVGWVAEDARPILLNDALQNERFDPQVDGFQEHTVSSLLCVPLQIKGKVIGVLEVVNKAPPFEFDEEDQSVLITLAAQASIALENARLYNSLRAERDRIVEAEERTRHELARNLHDGPVQLLAAISMGLNYLERLIDVQPEAVRDEINSLRKLTWQAIQEARMLLFELRPVILETRGLVAALYSYVERLSAGGRLVPHFDPGNFDRRLDARVAGTIFSIVQEAVNNAQKHADARNVWIRLQEQDGYLIVSIEDDGKGFDVDSVLSSYDMGDSLGLLNMRERAELIDGELTIKSGPQRGKPGTLVQLRVVLPDLSRGGGADER